MFPELLNWVMNVFTIRQETGQKFKITQHGFIFMKIIYIHTKKKEKKKMKIRFHNPAARYIAD